MTAFAAIVFLVGAAALLIGFVSLFGRSPFKDLGRQGTLWFDHLDDLPVSERPSEDERDAPLPRRPLRGRP